MAPALRDLAIILYKPRETMRRILDSGRAEPAITWNGDAYLLTWSAQEMGEANFDIQAVQLSVSGNPLGNTTSITETDSDESSPALSTAGSTRVFAYSGASAEAGGRLYLWFDDEAPRRHSVRH